MTEAEIRDRLRQRLTRIEERLSAACRRAGRHRADVTLVAVTKTVGVEVARLLPEMGIHDLGESRPQELWKKAAALATSEVRWHMIGHLQRNKIKPTTDMVYLLHSLDNLRLAEEISRQTPRRLPVLLEVNASREANKHGFAPEEVMEVQRMLAENPKLQTLGLMTMAAYADDPESSRPTFREVAQLRAEARLPLLSMGMSNDFEVAVEEGATHIRLGSLLFEGLEAAAGDGATP